MHKKLMILFVDYLIRMGSAFLAGALIGLERQCRQRNAGLRTNILVSVGSAAFTVLSYAITSQNGDPSRVAAQIVSGIGFLGGGLILKDGFNVRGLNTAATIWCSAACGTLAGVGFFSELAVLVACVLVTHCLFRPLCHFIETKFEGAASLTVKVECDKESLDAVRNIITNTLLFGEARVNELFYKEADGVFVVFCDFEARGDDWTLSELIIRRLQAHAGVISAGWHRRELRGGEL